jgi:tRNA A-37 threonylcarbamoyl transferase component Bud32
MVAEDSDPLIGRELAAFRIGTLLGRGAMGRVYTAEHTVLGRRVAIKVIEPRLAIDPEALQRFVEEARSVNSIRHPNIIDISDFGEVDGRPYFVMELLEGETLGARIAKWGHLPHASVVRICAQVANALIAAHDCGVIHRDLKPDNIFVGNHPDYPDHVKVLDFGIAKLTKHAAHASKIETEVGLVLGTPLYMSPEQSQGEAIDPRSDIYALGIVLFEALTGATPFDRPTVTEILIAHVHDTPPPLRAIDPTIPEALEAIVQRALAKSPGDRFADMREMRAALIACGEPAPARPPVPVLAIVPAAAATLPAQLALAIVPPAAIALPGAHIATTLRGIILSRIAANRLVLPSLPKATAAALAALRKPDVNLARVAEILEQDPLIAPQVLRIASCAVYGGSAVPTVHQALLRLGVRRVRSLLFELSIRRIFESPRPAFADAFR